MNQEKGTRIRDEVARRWLGKLTKLNPASARPPCHGKAPHKPLLLLTIIDMVEDGEFPAHTFARTAGMVLSGKIGHPQLKAHSDRFLWASCSSLSAKGQSKEV